MILRARAAGRKCSEMEELEMCLGCLSNRQREHTGNEFTKDTLGHFHNTVLTTNTVMGSYQWVL